MVKILLGEAGSGKTKKMISMANESVEISKGEVVFIDFSPKHIYDLHRNIRLIALRDLNLESLNSFYGFICGLISENYDIEKIFVDDFHHLKLKIKDYTFESFLNELNDLSKKFNTEIFISTSPTENIIPNNLKDYTLQEELV